MEQTNKFQGRFGFCRRVILLIGTAIVSIAGLARGQQPSLDTSLQMVPQSAAFYWSSMNHAALWNSVNQSEAYRRVQKTPLAVKLRNAYRRGISRGWESFGSNPLRYYLEGWANSIDSPGGKLVMPFLKQIVGHELFVYGDARWIEWRTAVNAVYTELGPRLSEMERSGDNDYRHVWPIVLDKLGGLKTPTLVAGAFVDEPTAFSGLLELAASGLEQAFREIPPELEYLANGFSVDRGEGRIVLRWLLDGNEIPWELLGETPDFEDLRPTLEALCRDKTLGLAIGVQGQMLFFALGENNEHLRRWGSGPMLVDLPELQPVKSALAAGTTLTGVSYLSAETVAANRNFRGAFGMVPLVVEQMLREPTVQHVPDETRQKLLADLRTAVEELEIELSRGESKAGPYVSYSFLQPQGIEGYVLDYSEPASSYSSEPFAVLSHLGSDPALFVVERNRELQTRYQFWRRLVARGFDLAEAYLPDFAANPPDSQKVAEILDRIGRSGTRLDALVADTLIPQTEGRSLALVLDLSHQRDTWFREMPAHDVAVPLPGLALAIEFESRQAIESLGAEVRSFAEEVVGVLRELNPELPADFELPQAVVTSTGDSTVYAYPLPTEAGASDAISPHVRIKDRMLFLGYLLPQTADLAAEHRLQLFGPAGESAGAVSLAYLDVGQWVDAGAMWFQYAVAAHEVAGQPIGLRGGGEDPLLDMTREEIEQSLAAWYQFFKCCRGYSARSDFVDGVQRTHYLWRFDDLPIGDDK